MDLNRREVYFVGGINPEPWTAPSFARRNKGKSDVYKSESLRVYQEAIAEEFVRLYPNVKPTDEPCEITFCFWRELGRYKVGDGRKSQRHVADATNMQKATEDALQGILYTNDNLVTIVRSVIMQQDEDTDPGVLILFNRHPRIPSDCAKYASDVRDAPAPPRRSNIRGPIDIF